MVVLKGLMKPEEFEEMQRDDSLSLPNCAMHT